MNVKKLSVVSLLFFASITSNTFAFDIGSIFGESTYKVYSCKDSNHSSSNECTRQLSGTATFKVDKEKSEVFLIFTNPTDNKKYIRQLEDCKVIDKINWKCGGKITSTDNYGVALYMREYEYHMVNGDVEMTDMYSRNSFKGKTQNSSYSKGNKFVKE